MLKRATTLLPMKMSIVVASLLFLLLPGHAAADEQLEHALNHQYKNQTYTFRVPFFRDSQEYDSNGKLITYPGEGPWTIYGRVMIKKIKLEPTRVVIEGQRIGTELRKNKLSPLKLDHPMELQIDLTQPLSSTDQFESLLNRVFASTKEEFLASVPEFWREYLEKNLEVYSDHGRVMEFKEAALSHPQPKDKKPDDQPRRNRDGAYYLGAGVRPPHPVSTPDPDYDTTAKSERLTGTNAFSVVVDETGKIIKVTLIRPLGLGLEESTAKTLQTWKLDPGQVDGRAVKVVINIETTFQVR